MKFLAFFLLCVWSAFTQSAATAPSVAWRVEAPFALFGLLPHPEKSAERWFPRPDETFEKWAFRIADEHKGRSPFAEFRNTEGAKDPWLPEKGHYRAEYSRPDSTAIQVWLPGVTGTCRWRLGGEQDYSESLPCEEKKRLPAVPLSGATVTVLLDATKVEISAEVRVDHKVIVALGDSYAAGEGNPDVPTSWRSESVASNSTNWLKKAMIQREADWWDVACHRSFWSHQTFAAIKAAAAHPHRLVTYLH